ncbi:MULTISPECIES: SRPBCC family protein [Chryseobacterium]|uniref:Ligand-binding SRPBCC domain-containing protein n=1 Tax=Chryseobacterium camelliae TaxID=1265445 RepID=A0ABU0TIZ1_9FLAO|nr:MULTISPECIES: SRPBCC family protein [Chryseobacterium]MDT3409355.1 ligand-binding SRPBCC domain-containing protein [Pseudacidovorax intermedius]MDQ1096781.1 ligand-binding SRPBCC domain-containing protein [Chryseobacterium camelliae]MDQ1100723.1 ligand-binding SRPBCC domain-containing protein [Chryseobacterium sp. SORGH_AS_1048]MDR6088062.1 ligand-binding SRPBCC domain-containing protein [Chryseobacterium sp. SORGH_AS_0909]MDR6132437.1 ligand-binding SRPBCC domain-containing protein [Chryse
MPAIILKTKINADILTVFDLARNVDVHRNSMSDTEEIAIAGRTTGLIETGETVTWKARHLGIQQTLTSKIISMDRPYEFTDIMIQGVFRSMHHQHIFRSEGKATVMTDIFDFESPFGIIGKAFNALYLTRYMRNILLERNRHLKQFAESILKTHEG